MDPTTVLCPNGPAMPEAKLAKAVLLSMRIRRSTCYDIAPRKPGTVVAPARAGYMHREDVSSARAIALEAD